MARRDYINAGRGRLGDPMGLFGRLPVVHGGIGAKPKPVIKVVQTTDPDGDGYNPAVAIKLAAAGLGTYVDENDKTKGWYLTPEQAAAVTTLPTFYTTTSVTDTDGIAGTVGASYDFTNFDEIVHFTALTTLADNSFAGCQKLTSVIVPETITSLGRGVFSYNTLPLAVQFLAENCTSASTDNPATFQNSPIASFTFGDKVKIIPEYLCSKCAMTSVVIPDSVTTIGARAFYDSALTSITISNGVTSIGNYAFGKTGLANLVIPDSVTSLGSGSILEMPNLTTLEIGTGLATIGGYTIHTCSALTTLIMRNTTPPTLQTNAIYNCGNLADIYVPAASVDAYKAAANWSAYASIIQAIPE